MEKLHFFKVPERNQLPYTVQ